MRQKQSRPKLLQAMLDAFSLPDLRRRILITGLILIIFRFISHIPLPGVNTEALSSVFQQNALLGMLDLFSGGAMKQFSVAAMGVYPYITSSIIIILLVPVIPKLQALSQEGEAGKNKINMITHWLTVPLAGLSGYGQLVLLQRTTVPMADGTTAAVVSATSPLLTVTIVMSLIAGTLFLVWLGELITEYGIGNGISIIIFGGIVAGYPELIREGFGANVPGLIAYLIIVLITVTLIVMFTEAHRRVPVQYARSVFKGGRMYRQAGSTHIPLRVNASGMIPLIFSMSIILFPGMVASYFVKPNDPGFADTLVRWFSPDTGLPVGLFYWVSYFVLSVAFTFFYTMITYNQQDLPGTLQKQGGFIPGIRPGKNTSSYLSGVINRITWAGALFLGFIAVMPFLARSITNVQQIQLSSLGMLIVVGVILDTMKQLEAQLVMRRYEGFIK